MKMEEKRQDAQPPEAKRPEERPGEGMGIDLIIPAYNAHGTLFRTLASIAQQTIAGELSVTIVDDASEAGYEALAARFRPALDVRVLRMEENGGPGAARQYGIDHTEKPLLAFVDADDTLAHAFSLQLLRDHLLAEPGFHTCAGAFIEVNHGRFLPHAGDFVWVFGKLYRREFLMRHGIRFNEAAARANEDAGFNALVRLHSTAEERVKFLSDVVYFWHETPSSITRAEDCRYTYDQSFVGYVENMIYAIQAALRERGEQPDIRRFAGQCMAHLYTYYLETCVRAPHLRERNLAYCVRFYREVFRGLSIGQDLLAALYGEEMRAAYLSGRFQGIVPELGLPAFLEQLEAEAGDKEETDDTGSR